MVFVEALMKLSISTIYRMLKLYRAAANRLMQAGWLEEIPDDWRGPLVSKVDGHAEGILGIKQYFYGKQGRFLVGIPSQLR